MHRVVCKQWYIISCIDARQVTGRCCNTLIAAKAFCSAQNLHVHHMNAFAQSWPHAYIRNGSRPMVSSLVIWLLKHSSKNSACLIPWWMFWSTGSQTLLLSPAYQQHFWSVGPMTACLLFVGWSRLVMMSYAKHIWMVEKPCCMKGRWCNRHNLSQCASWQGFWIRGIM